MKRGLIFSLLILSSCVSPFASFNQLRDKDFLIEEMHTEIAELKHSLHSTEIELKLLQENLEHQTDTKVGQVSELVEEMSKKISMLSKNHDKLCADLKSLAAHAGQTTTALSQYRTKIQELEKSLSLAQRQQKQEKKEEHYRVQSGDTLEKIARLHHTTVQHLKVLNGLQGEIIYVGQLLKISKDES